MVTELDSNISANTEPVIVVTTLDSNRSVNMVTALDSNRHVNRVTTLDSNRPINIVITLDINRPIQSAFCHADLDTCRNCEALSKGQ